MRNNKIITFILFVILMVTILTIVNSVTIKSGGGLVAPGFIQQIIHGRPTPAPTPEVTPNAPKTFQFDSSTDLKMELNKVNPQVLDSDFE